MGNRRPPRQVSNLPAAPHSHYIRQVYKHMIIHFWRQT